MIYENVSPEALSLNTRELSTRLGMPVGTRFDGMEDIKRRLFNEAKPAYTVRRVKIQRDGDFIKIGNTLSVSRALATLCDGKDECLLLVATLGIGVDRLVMRTASISPSDAFVIDAMADALVEALCDYAQARATFGLDTTGRFSPGYGDLELDLGREIIAMTDAERTLGIKHTSGGLMVPKKSVNAIIAIRKDCNV